MQNYCHSDLKVNYEIAFLFSRHIHHGKVLIALDLVRFCFYTVALGKVKCFTLKGVYINTRLRFLCFKSYFVPSISLHFQRRKPQEFPQPRIKMTQGGAISPGSEHERTEDGSKPQDQQTSGERASPPVGIDTSRTDTQQPGERFEHQAEGSDRERATPPAGGDTKATDTDRLKLSPEAHTQGKTGKCANPELDSVAPSADIREPHAGLNQTQDSDCAQATLSTVKGQESDCGQATSPKDKDHDSDCGQATSPKDKDHDSDCAQATSPKDKDHDSDCAQATSPKDKDHESDCAQATSPKDKDHESDRAQATSPKDKDHESDCAQATSPKDKDHDSDCAQATSPKDKDHESDCVQATSPKDKDHESDCVQATSPKDKDHDHDSDCGQATSPRDKDHESDCAQATSPEDKDRDSDCAQATSPKDKDHESDCAQATSPKDKDHESDCTQATSPEDKDRDSDCLQATSPKDKDYESDCAQATLPTVEDDEGDCGQATTARVKEDYNVNKEEIRSSHATERDVVSLETGYKDRTSGDVHSQGEDGFRMAHEEVKSDSDEGLAGSSEIDQVPYSVTESEREITSQFIAVDPVAGDAAIATPADDVYSLDDNPAIERPYPLSVERVRSPLQGVHQETDMTYITGPEFSPPRQDGSESQTIENNSNQFQNIPPHICDENLPLPEEPFIGQQRATRLSLEHIQSHTVSTNFGGIQQTPTEEHRDAKRNTSNEAVTTRNHDRSKSSRTDRNRIRLDCPGCFFCLQKTTSQNTAAAEVQTSTDAVDEGAARASVEIEEIDIPEFEGTDTPRREGRNLTSTPLNEGSSSLHREDSIFGSGGATPQSNRKLNFSLPSLSADFLERGSAESTSGRSARPRLSFSERAHSSRTESMGSFRGVDRIAPESEDTGPPRRESSSRTAIQGECNTTPPRGGSIFVSAYEEGRAASQGGSIFVSAHEENNASPQSESSVLVSAEEEGNVTPQRESSVDGSEHGESYITPRKEESAPHQREDCVRSRRERPASPRRDCCHSPGWEHKVPSQSETSARPQSESELSSRGRCCGCDSPECEGNTPAQNGKNSIAQEENIDGAQRVGYDTPPRVDNVEPQRESYATPRREDYVEPQRERYVIPLREDYVEPQRVGYATPPRVDNVEPQIEGYDTPPRLDNVAPQRVGYATPPRLDNVEPQRERYDMPPRLDNVEPQRDRYATPPRVNDVEPQREGYVTPPRVDDVESHREGYATPPREDYVQSQRERYVIPLRDDYEEPQNEGYATPPREDNVEPQREDNSPQHATPPRQYGLSPHDSLSPENEDSFSPQWVAGRLCTVAIEEHGKSSPQGAGASAQQMFNLPRWEEGLSPRSDDSAVPKREDWPSPPREEFLSSEIEEILSSEIEESFSSEIEDRVDSPQREDVITPERNYSPLNDHNVSPQSENDDFRHRGEVVIPERDTSVLPHREDSVSSGREDISPEREAKVSPEREANVLPQKEANILPQKKDSVSLERGANVSPERSTNVSPERGANVSPEREANVLPQREANVSPEREAKVLPQREDSVSPEREANVSSETETNVSPEREANVSPEREANVSPQREANVSTEREAKVSTEKEGSVSPEREVNVSPEREANVSPEREGSVSPEREANVSPEREGSVSPEREANVSPEREGSVSPEREANVSPEREGSVSPEREVNVSPEREGSVSTGREANVLPQREANLSIRREVNALSQREDSVLPEREPNVLSQREGSISPEREDSVSPETEANASPEREGNKAREKDGFVPQVRGLSVFPHNERCISPQTTVSLRIEANVSPPRASSFSLQREGRASNSFSLETDDKLTSERKGIISPQREGGVSPQREGSLSPQREIGVSPRKEQKEGGVLPRKEQREGGLSPQREGSLSPQREGSLSPQREGSLSPQREGSLSPQREGSLSPQREGSLSPQREGGVSPQREGRVSPQREGSLSPQREGSLSPQREGGLSPQREGSLSPQREGGVVPQKEQKEGGVSPQREGRLSPQREGRVSPQREGSLSPQREGGQREGRLSPQREGRVSPQREGSLSPQREGGVSPQKQQRVGGLSPQKQQREGGVSPRREIGVSPRKEQREGGVSTQREGSLSPQREGGVSPKREGSLSPQREGGVVPQKEQREGGVSPQREGRLSPQREGGVSPQREGSVSPQREGGVSPQREGGVSPQRESSLSPQREGGVSPQREGGVSPQREGSVSPQREGGGPPQREGGGPPQRVGSVSPQGEDSVSPKREGGDSLHRHCSLSECIATPEKESGSYPPNKSSFSSQRKLSISSEKENNILPQKECIASPDGERGALSRREFSNSPQRDEGMSPKIESNPLSDRADSMPLLRTKESVGQGGEGSVLPQRESRATNAATSTRTALPTAYKESVGEKENHGENKKQLITRERNLAGPYFHDCRSVPGDESTPGPSPTNISHAMEDTCRTPDKDNTDTPSSDSQDRPFQHSLATDSTGGSLSTTIPETPLTPSDIRLGEVAGDIKDSGVRDSQTVRTSADFPEHDPDDDGTKRDASKEKKKKKKSKTNMSPNDSLGYANFPKRARRDEESGVRKEQQKDKAQDPDPESPGRNATDDKEWQLFEEEMARREAKARIEHEVLKKEIDKVRSLEEDAREEKRRLLQESEQRPTRETENSSAGEGLYGGRKDPVNLVSGKTQLKGEQKVKRKPTEQEKVAWFEQQIKKFSPNYDRRGSEEISRGQEKAIKKSPVAGNLLEQRRKRKSSEAKREQTIPQRPIGSFKKRKSAEPVEAAGSTLPPCIHRRNPNSAHISKNGKKNSSSNTTGEDDSEKTLRQYQECGKCDHCVWHQNERLMRILKDGWKRKGMSDSEIEQRVQLVDQRARESYENMRKMEERREEEELAKQAFDIMQRQGLTSSDINEMIQMVKEQRERRTLEKTIADKVEALIRNAMKKEMSKSGAMEVESGRQAKQRKLESKDSKCIADKTEVKTGVVSKQGVGRRGNEAGNVSGREEDEEEEMQREQEPEKGQPLDLSRKTSRSSSQAAETSSNLEGAHKAGSEKTKVELSLVRGEGYRPNVEDIISGDLLDSTIDPKLLNQDLGLAIIELSTIEGGKAGTNDQNGVTMEFISGEREASKEGARVRAGTETTRVEQEAPGATSSKEEMPRRLAKELEGLQHNGKKRCQRDLSFADLQGADLYFHGGDQPAHPRSANPPVPYSRWFEVCNPDERDRASRHSRRKPFRIPREWLNSSSPYIQGKLFLVKDRGYRFTWIEGYPVFPSPNARGDLDTESKHFPNALKRNIRDQQSRLGATKSGESDTGKKEVGEGKVDEKSLNGEKSDRKTKGITKMHKEKDERKSQLPTKGQTGDDGRLTLDKIVTKTNPPLPNADMNDSKNISGLSKPDQKGTENKPLLPKPDQKSTESKPLLPKPDRKCTESKPLLPKPDQKSGKGRGLLPTPDLEPLSKTKAKKNSEKQREDKINEKRNQMGADPQQRSIAQQETKGKDKPKCDQGKDRVSLSSASPSMPTIAEVDESEASNVPATSTSLGSTKTAAALPTESANTEVHLPCTHAPKTSSRRTKSRRQKRYKMAYPDDPKTGLSQANKNPSFSSKAGDKTQNQNVDKNAKRKQQNPKVILLKRNSEDNENSHAGIGIGEAEKLHTGKESKVKSADNLSEKDEAGLTKTSHNKDDQIKRSVREKGSSSKNMDTEESGETKTRERDTAGKKDHGTKDDRVEKDILKECLKYSEEEHKMIEENSADGKFKTEVDFDAEVHDDDLSVEGKKGKKAKKKSKKLIKREKKCQKARVAAEFMEAKIKDKKIEQSLKESRRAGNQQSHEANRNSKLRDAHTYMGILENLLRALTDLQVSSDMHPLFVVRMLDKHLRGEYNGKISGYNTDVADSGPNLAGKHSSWSRKGRESFGFGEVENSLLMKEFKQNVDNLRKTKERVKRFHCGDDVSLYEEHTKTPCSSENEKDGVNFTENKDDGKREDDSKSEPAKSKDNIGYRGSSPEDEDFAAADDDDSKRPPKGGDRSPPSGNGCRGGGHGSSRQRSDDNRGSGGHPRDKGGQGHRDNIGGRGSPRNRGNGDHPDGRGRHKPSGNKPGHSPKDAEEGRNLTDIESILDPLDRAAFQGPLSSKEKQGRSPRMDGGGTNHDIGQTVSPSDGRGSGPQKDRLTPTHNLESMSESRDLRDNQITVSENRTSELHCEYKAEDLRDIAEIRKSHTDKCIKTYRFGFDAGNFCIVEEQIHSSFNGARTGCANHDKTYGNYGDEDENQSPVNCNQNHSSNEDSKLFKRYDDQKIKVCQ